jgi:DNA-binding NarL/FixJ family response regulator
MLAAENGDYVTAASQALSARREFEAIGDYQGAARASTVLGNVAKYHGDVVAARMHLTAAVASQRASGDDWGTAVALQNLASLVIDQAELRHGRVLMEESLALKRRAGDRRSLGYGLINLSDLHLREQMSDQARAALAEAATIASGLGDDRLAAFVEHNLGDVDMAAGDSVQAAQHYRRALEGFLLVHDRRDVALALCSLGRAFILGGERREGITRLRESESLAAEIDDELRLSEARAALAAHDLPPATANLPGQLTARQAEILTAMSAGLSNRDIAARFEISDGTVARHIANIYRKIGVNNRVGAVRYALAHGLGTAAR